MDLHGEEWKAEKVRRSIMRKFTKKPVTCMGCGFPLGMKGFAPAVRVGDRRSGAYRHVDHFPWQLRGPEDAQR